MCKFLRSGLTLIVAAHYLPAGGAFAKCSAVKNPSVIEHGLGSRISRIRIAITEITSLEVASEPGTQRNELDGRGLSYP